MTDGKGAGAADADSAKAHRRISLALFLAGFATFSLIYCVQPILPQLAEEFGTTPSSSSLALSFTTAALAFAIPFSAPLSRHVPKRRMMFVAMTLAALCNLGAALVVDWNALLALRLVEGLLLGGIPAIALAYLGEELPPRQLGRAIGLYVSGTAFGGMMGRVGVGVVTDLMSWQGAMAILSVIALFAALGFVLLLPSARTSVAVGGGRGRDFTLWMSHLRNPDLLRLFALGFLLTGIFLTLFSYAGFRLSAAPFDLGPTEVSLMFLTYMAGVFVSPLAGRAADKLGRRPPLLCAIGIMILGVCVTIPDSLMAIALGILMVTIGFFASHSIASGWVAQVAETGKSHASSLYLLFYYLGMSVTGLVGGQAWEYFGWPGVAGLTGMLALAAAMTALTLKGGQPFQDDAPPPPDKVPAAGP